jgi:hypothetical protein
MTGSSRLSICYVAPGRDLRPGTSHTRHVLSLARALAEEADVTVVFRRLLGAVGAEPFEVFALEDGSEVSGPDTAPWWRLGQLVEQGSDAVGIVLEGSGPSAGKLTAWCARRGVPAIPVIDHLPGTSWLAPLDAGRDWLALGSSGRYLGRVPAVVAGSDALRTAIVNRWRVPADRVAVIGPAVDRSRFAPRDQAEARRRLGLAADHRIVLAGDGLGSGPDLTPLIEAIQRAGDSTLRLHILGDGERRAALERLAGPGGAVTFHGHVPDDLVAAYIAAADLCVSVDERGDSAFTVRECLSAGRPVAIGAERSHALVRHLVSGFLVDHDLLAWIRFIQRDCPSRNTLRFMGVAATATPLDGVDRTAAAYLETIERVRRNAPRAAAAR